VLKHYRPYCFIRCSNNGSKIRDAVPFRTRGETQSTRYIGVILAIAVLGSNLAPQISMAQSGASTTAISVDDAKRRAREAFAQKDYAQAVGWLRKAAEQGDADAEYGVGLTYRDGLGGGAIPRDYAQALIWFRKSADQGFASAQNDLGVMYQKGQGVPQNYQQAMAWYRKAADQGYAIAQLNIGRLYEYGLGVPQDREQAMIWYRKATELGNADAKAKLAELQGSPDVASKTISLTCHNIKGDTAVTIDTVAKTVRVEGGMVIEYRDGKDEYVTITNDSVEFGCRNPKRESELVGEMAENMLSPANPAKTAKTTQGLICLIRNRIDRKSGVWTAVNTGEILTGRTESSRCVVAAERKF